MNADGRGSGTPDSGRRGSDGHRRRSAAALPRRGFIRGSLCLSALAVSGACAYTTRPGLPAHIRTVRVEVFENRTPYPGIEAELVSAIVREFAADGTVLPTSRAADSVLRGRVVRVRREVLQEDALDDVVTGRVTVEVVISLEDSARGAVLLRNEFVTSRGTDASEGIWRLRSGQSEAEGRAAAVRSLARNVMRKVVELW